MQEVFNLTLKNVAIYGSIHLCKQFKPEYVEYFNKKVWLSDNLSETYCSSCTSQTRLVCDTLRLSSWRPSPMKWCQHSDADITSASRKPWHDNDNSMSLSIKQPKEADFDILKWKLYYIYNWSSLANLHKGILRRLLACFPFRLQWFQSYKGLRQSSNHFISNMVKYIVAIHF